MANENLEQSLIERVDQLEAELKRHRITLNVIQGQIYEASQREILFHVEAIRKELESMQE